MRVSVFARAGLVLVAAALLQAAGCRSSTDRIRVLEAEKADAERRNQDLKHKQAEMRANLIEAESEAETERARAEALEARMELLAKKREEEESRRGEVVETVDIDDLRDEFEGLGVTVTDREGGGATIVLASDITFKSGRADLNNSAQTVLRRVALALKKTRGYSQVRIEGYTDSDPIRKSGWKNNAELSLARASKVRMFLVSQGIDETLLSVKGYGEKNPIAANTTKEGKARNRRVEIVLLAEK